MATDHDQLWHDVHAFRVRYRALVGDLAQRAGSPPELAVSMLYVGMYLGTDHSEVAAPLLGHFLAHASPGQVASFIADCASLLPPIEVPHA